MKTSQFLNALNRVRNSYTWTLQDGRVVGVARRGNHKGKIFNPVTALARTTQRGVFDSSPEGTAAAASVLDLPSSVVTAVVAPAKNGNSVVLKGRILKVLEKTSN